MQATTTLNHMENTSLRMTGFDLSFVWNGHILSQNSITTANIAPS